MSKFEGFSEEDIRQLRARTRPRPAPPAGLEDQSPTNVKKIDKLGAKPRKMTQPYKSPCLTDEQDDQTFNALNASFEKCKLSFKSTPQDIVNNNSGLKNETIDNECQSGDSDDTQSSNIDITHDIEAVECNENANAEPDMVTNDVKPDVTSNNNYNEEVARAHTAKMEELQMQQKLMEEQNRRRKEMLAKALADRTRQTEEEVVKLDKIKKELNILDGQFSQDVAVLRKKIDQACLTFAEAEKQYLRVEKEFLQAKINLQKEKEKKELLTEHLCALITHNETRKAQKLETLMEQLAYNGEVPINCVEDKIKHSKMEDPANEEAIVVDGVDERTGKMVEINDSFS